MKFATSALFLAAASLVAGQFITSPCTSDADCDLGCCGFNTGRCAGPVVAQERDGGCGFGDATPNDNAAVAFRAGEAPAATQPEATEQPAAAPQTPAVAPGTQFITGACSSDADCAQGCCGFTTGRCAGPVVAQERDGGCGFGDAQPNANAVNNLKKRQNKFITQDCANDAECDSGCCGFESGKCAGAVVALERDGGCGFGDAEPNDNAAQVLRGGAPAAADDAADDAADAPAADEAADAPAVAPGTQFITGPCTSDADCAQGCCGFNSGRCAGPAVAQERDGGCGFGDATPNDDALQAILRMA